jgi:hypothetical protein
MQINGVLKKSVCKLGITIMERKSKQQGSKHGERRLITKIGQHNENHRTPKIRTDFPMLKVGNGKYNAPGSPVAN